MILTYIIQKNLSYFNQTKLAIQPLFSLKPFLFQFDFNDRLAEAWKYENSVSTVRMMTVIRKIMTTMQILIQIIIRQQCQNQDKFGDSVKKCAM